MSENGWVLEIVKGREEGRRYPLRPGEQVLGNALNGSPGLDLGDQETSPTRRMSARHASLDVSNGSASLRDLETPGGTFVNRQRLLPGQARPLQDGDLIQLAGIQLLFRSSHSQSTTPASVKPTPSGAIVLSLKDGTTCRTWDEVVTLSSQKWAALRDELTSGRLADWLRSRNFERHLPRPSPGASPDEQLDAWLKQLPVTKPVKAELDVHPSRLTVRAGAEGSVSRATLRISNVGYGLLRSRIQVEPPGTNWVRSAHFANTITTVDQTDIALDVETPASVRFPISAFLVIESDGGSARVEVVLQERPKASADLLPPAVSGHASQSALSDLFTGLLGRLGMGQRLIAFAITFALLRIVLSVSGSWSFGTVSGAEPPHLIGVAAFLAAGMGSFCGFLSLRAKSIANLPFAAFAGAGLGVLVATLLVATARTVDPILGVWSNSTIPTTLLWAAIGTILGGASLVIVKPKTQ